MNWTPIIGATIYLAIGAYTAVKCDQARKAPNKLALAIGMFAWPIIAGLVGYYFVRTVFSGRI